ncbi:DUF262 domain-containing protein [Herbidospora mongoliensis]|uniref:DUF262 domain-containing protein n=1 Tax=Herbidospora mongoliensis TaxID=688067 RepID=UPI0008306750|nr:DUF262 domain-containing protein [Herbidospora mongoliensis]
MKADTRTPAEIFGSPIRYLIPLFQRPYVWNRTDQWEPLWEDVRAVAEQLLTTKDTLYGGSPVPPHFLGAIVLEQQLTPTAFIPVRHVIDGQQRLTTLQILLDAAQLVAERHGLPIDGRALESLVLNDKDLAQRHDEIFKVWPTDRDQEAFRAVMDNEQEVPESLVGSSIASAHTYFVSQIIEWAQPEGDPDKCRSRITALTHAMRSYLRLVVIDLEPGDNAQVIFETLNHRGTPLLAADLIKNMVFQLAAGQNEDLRSLYEQYWKPFDSNHWRRDVRQGRLYRPYVDIFINYWLTMRLLRDVPADRVFSEFREHIRTTQLPAWEVMRDLADDADVYAGLEHLPWESAQGTFYYRVISVMEASVVGPFLLWILRWPPERISPEQRIKALRSMESWLVRRMLCKLTTKNYNRIVVELLRELDRHGPEKAGDVTESYLAKSTATAGSWPADKEVIEAIRAIRVYKDLTRGRLRMVLEALEDLARGKWAEHEHCPRGRLTIEHVMPQNWEEHWSINPSDHGARQSRSHLVQTLGNLTLANERLNPKLSNRPWTDLETETLGLTDSGPVVGKRSLLQQHSTLKLNAEIVVANPAVWTDKAIVDRSATLAQRIIQIWPRPATP